VSPGREDESVELAEVFGEVARQLLSEHLVPATLQRIVELAVEHLEACEHAGITVIEAGRVLSPASSDDVPRIVDAIQAEVGEGPCVDAIVEHEVFITGDLLSERRWPQFSRRAHQETGVTSILSIRLFVEHDTMGALNLYSTQVDAFDATDVALAAVFATHAAVAMSAARREAHLERKAASHDLIGRAKGIVMALRHISDDDAFALLRDASQRLNVKLTAVAQRVNDTGEVPNGDRSV
jgi:GAF domain-containing protein